MKKIYLFLVIIAFSLFGCEKDDICSDETTPRVIIEFYNISNPTVKLNVTNLKVTGIDESEDLDVFSGVSKIELPLKNTNDITRYSFTLNSTNVNLKNEDILEFNYTRKEVFVSRACGYKIVYELNSGNGIFHTDSETPDELWIKNIFIENNSINTENETHIKIYF
jgi:hypothetical protein